MPTLEALGIDRMSADERLALIAASWDSIATQTEATPLTDAQKAEVERRWAAYQANPQAAIPWEQVEAAALALVAQPLTRDVVDKARAAFASGRLPFVPQDMD